MTVDLAQFFRRTLALAERERITLAEEVALCGHFLAIEKRRFGAKLDTELRVSAAAADCLLPPMTLQPLLENAIKHGIRQVDGGGTIAVDALVRDGALHIAVVNPVAPDDAPAGAHGVGLKNLRERLGVLYGPRARIGWQRSQAQFAIEIQLPVDKEASA
jgi:LytS/YehU family sensor histidine kinase